MRTQEALDLANDVIERVDAHILWHREGHELAMTLAYAVKALALECEGLQGQLNVLTLRLRGALDNEKGERLGSPRS